uniref:USP domain-containing protein n=1 Tax=Macrostomum lignano TaxID=282301 RepID=A0A1I8I0G9_9PLAT
SAARLAEDHLFDEAQRLLFCLLCGADGRIRHRFVSAAVASLAEHRAPLVCVRLLAKLFRSFGAQAKEMLRWAVQDLHLADAIFSDMLWLRRDCDSEKAASASDAAPTPVTPDDALARLDLVFAFAQDLPLTAYQIDRLWHCLVAGQPAQLADVTLKWLFDLLYILLRQRRSGSIIDGVDQASVSDDACDADFLWDVALAAENSDNRCYSCRCNQ